MIIIVDYGMGNLRSILYKIQKLGVEIKLSSDEKEIEKADKILLPGVGHFAEGMKNIKESGLLNILNHCVLEKKTPIMGICLGMQLFSEWSEEGNVEGLNFIKGRTVKFNPDKFEPKLPIPHVGWNKINIINHSEFIKNVETNQKYYFVHSYHFDCSNKKDIVATTHYGYEFVSIVQSGNIFGTQFHPEKSHLKGFQILKNFVIND